MKMKILITALMLSLVGACSLQIPTEIAGGVILASDKVDSMQIEYGAHLENKEVLVELDALQEDILNTLKTGEGLANVSEYHNRALIVYATLKREAVERWDEMDDFQRLNMTNLDNDLVELNSKIIEFKNSTDSNYDKLTLVHSAITIIKFYGWL